jgi:hypothetical protein
MLTGFSGPIRGEKGEWRLVSITHSFFEPLQHDGQLAGAAVVQGGDYSSVSVILELEVYWRRFPTSVRLSHFQI